MAATGGGARGPLARRSGVILRQREVKGGSLTETAFGPDAPAVPVNDALDRRQTDPGARELGGGVEALERPEELVRVGHVEADAVVANEEVPVLGAAELDLADRLLPGELPRVLEEVGQRDAEEARVGARVELAVGAKLDAAVRLRRLELAGDLAAHVGDVDALHRDLVPRDSGELEEIVDEVRHLLRRAAHAG